MPGCLEGLDPSRPQADSLVLLVPLGDARCVRRQWGVCARVCEMWVVAGWLLLMWASVLCVERCGGVRRARAVRVCVLESRVRLRCCARAGVCCMMYCAVRLFTVLCSAGLAGRAARWAAARCGWLCACLMVCGGRSARPTGSSAAQGAGMRSALHVRLCARLARMFPCDEGRAYVFTLRARAGAEGGAVSPRSDAGWSSAWRGRARRRPCRHRVAREGKKSIDDLWKPTTQ